MLINLDIIMFKNTEGALVDIYDKAKQWEIIARVCTACSKKERHPCLCFEQLGHEIQGVSPEAPVVSNSSSINIVIDRSKF